ncbi:MAG: DUF4260 family protein [Gaiellaceae bacterium]
MEAALTHPSPTARRVAYALLALGLLAVVVSQLVDDATGWWQLAVFGLGPDVALLFGAGAGLARGQLHPRAVPLYNALHRFWGPLVLDAAAVAAGLPLGFAALAWGFHIAIDRSLGYGLRTPDGFQRS